MTTQQIDALTTVLSADYDHPINWCEHHHKKRYATKADAMRKLYECQRKGRTEQRFYRCSAGGYHLTSQLTAKSEPHSVETGLSGAVRKLAALNSKEAGR